MPQLEDRRVKRSRQQLQIALQTLLQHEPLDKITVKDLCATSDMARKTFYLHYVDKYALVAEMVTQLFQALAKICEQISDDDFQAKTLVWLDFFDQHQPLIQAILASSAASDYRQQLLTFVQTQIQQKALWRNNPALQHDPVRLQFLASGVIGVLDQYVLAAQTAQQQQIAQRLSDLLLENLH